VQAARHGAGRATLHQVCFQEWPEANSKARAMRHRRDWSGESGWRSNPAAMPKKKTLALCVKLTAAPGAFLHGLF
jgi:hypothetical protein